LCPEFHIFASSEKELPFMTTVTLAITLHAALIAGGQNYNDAYRDAEQSGKPLLVVLGTDWCPACRSMRYATAARMEREGKLRDVAFAYVDADRESDLARYMMRGGAVPQVVVYQKTATGWFKGHLIGAQSERSLLELIDRARRAAAASASHLSGAPTSEPAGAQ
jgi:thioredoxin-like negative regulator of GroEL